MSSSFYSWLKCYLKRKTDDWISTLADEFRKKYEHAIKPEWVKEGIIESYRVATDTFKSLVLAIASGLVSWMMAQVPTTARIIPLQWNLSMIAVAAVLVIILHLRLNYKISMLNSQMDAICGVKGVVFIAPPKPPS